MKHRYKLDMKTKTCYFKCYVCKELVSLKYPETFEDSEKQLEQLKEAHSHGGIA